MRGIRKAIYEINKDMHDTDKVIQTLPKSYVTSKMLRVDLIRLHMVF